MTFFFDNSISRRIAEALKCLGVNAIHLQQCFPPDVDDLTWISAAGDKDWIVVTADVRIRRNPAQSTALAEANLVAVFICKQYAGKKHWEQAAWLVKQWPSIQEKAERAKKGTNLYVNWGGKITEI